MIITTELVISLYEFIKIEIVAKFDYLDEITKKLNLTTEEFIIQIKEIVSKKLYLERKDKDLDVSESFLQNLFNLFLENYNLYDELRANFILSQFSEEDLGKIKTIELKNFYISVIADQLRLYNKKEFVKDDNILLNKKNGIIINLYDMHIDFAEPENYINDMLEVSDKLIIVLFINLMFLFNIENNNFNLIKFIKEKYKLVKCCKFDKAKILIGTENNLLIYEILDNYVLQKIAIIEFGVNLRKNYYFFNKIIVVNNKETIQLFSIDKKFKLTKIKKDYIINKNTRIKICYIKKINKFVLLENCLLARKKLILTDFDKVYDEIKVSTKANYIQEFSQNDEFLLLFIDNFSKYKIENNKFKLIFSVKINRKDKFLDNFHILNISDDWYFITGYTGYIIYKYDKKDEIEISSNDE